MKVLSILQSAAAFFAREQPAQILRAEGGMRVGVGEASAPCINHQYALDR
jgi:hypothetical protein